MKMLIAVVRTTSLERIVHELEKIGVRGLTISEVRGIGEEVHLNDPYAIHDRIEVLLPDEQAERAVQIILDHAATGLAGDGIVAVLPVDYAVRIRTRERVA